MDQADWRDIEATLAGHGEAYARIVRRYQNDIARRMWRFTRDRRELEELVQDVFVEAYTSLASYRGTGPFDHWLSRLATRVGYRLWKRRRRAEKTVAIQDWDAPDPSRTQEAQLEAAEAAERLHRVLGQLAPRDRLVLTLMYLEEMSVAEIADHTGWSRTMVKVQAHRARKKLRALMEQAEKTDRASGDDEV